MWRNGTGVTVSIGYVPHSRFISPQHHESPVNCVTCYRMIMVNWISLRFHLWSNQPTTRDVFVLRQGWGYPLKEWLPARALTPVNCPLWCEGLVTIYGRLVLISLCEDQRSSQWWVMYGWFDVPNWVFGCHIAVTPKHKPGLFVSFAFLLSVRGGNRR